MYGSASVRNLMSLVEEWARTRATNVSRFEAVSCEHDTYTDVTFTMRIYAPATKDEGK